MSNSTNPPSHRAADVTRLIRQIEALLTADSRFDIKSLVVRVVPDDGHVGLVGWVSRLPEKIWIEQIAADVAGPDNVRSCLLVGPPGQRPDQEIVEAVRNALDQDRSIDATSIQVNVSQGVVSLGGLVDTSLHRRFAGAMCWWISGVRGVVNDLSAIYTEPENDERLAETIQAVMEKDPLVDRTEILVLSHGGVVTLTGTVGGEDARDAAEHDAWIVEGVRDVFNQIEVAPGGAAAGRIDGFGG
jgi:hyperosmotically inducible protein